jgi:RHS repeat-associated protein
MQGLSYQASNRPANLYLYNGKELQQELDLDWYDYGARIYDAQLGRFFTIDPLAEKYNFQSPYVYAKNNPIIYLDNNGEGPWDVIKGVGLIIGGVVQIVGGVASACTPTGVGQIGGVALIMNGSATIAWGSAVIVNNGEKDIPTGTGQAIGRILDQSNESDNHTFETAGSITDFFAGLPSGGASGKAIDLATNVANPINAVNTVETVINVNTPENNSKSKSENNTTPDSNDNNTQSNKPSFNFNNKYKDQLIEELNPKAVQDNTRY